MGFPTTPQAVTDLVDAAITRADALLEAVCATDDPSWHTVMAPLDEITDVVQRANGRGAFLGHVHDDAQMRAAARAGEERLDQWAVAMVFREDLHRAVTAYATTDEAAALDAVRARLLDHTLRDLRRAGHDLAPDARAELQTLTARLVELGVQFQQHLADHDDAIVVTADDVEGLPDGWFEQLPLGKAPGTRRVTMVYPHAIPFLEHARRRDLREQLQQKFDSRAVDTNLPLLEEAVRARRGIAELFGEPSWAHHQLRTRMAEDPATVRAFYHDLVPSLTTAATAEIEDLRQLLADDLDDPDVTLQRWDWRYAHARMQTRHGVDGQKVAAYLELDRVLAGLLDVTGDVFGLDYAPVDLDTWHPDVRSLEVHDRATGTLLAHVHLDLFPREGTFGHAAVFTIEKGRRRDDGSWQLPVAALVTNLPEPGPDRPSLLSHPEVETLFHEFGHVLHHVLTTVELTRFSGIGTERDFVEAPSQIMEHWTWRPEVLARFARHHDTDEVIPTSLVDAMVTARNLNVALQTLRQVQFGMLDQLLHDEDAATADIDDCVRRSEELMLLGHQEGTCYATGFGHLMSGYDAGYYGYLWSEVYGDDMFQRFAEEGVLSPEVGADYRREVLAPGGTRDAIDLVESFLGRPSDNRAFLAKLGISPT